MANDMPGWGRVVPFARSATELQHRALRQRKGKQWLEAVELLRRAVEMEPNNEDLLLDLAETYTQMGCCALSNRILLRVLRANPESHGCYFALGCNFYAMQDWAQARDCLNIYVQESPEGEYRRDANDLLLHLYLHESSRAERRIARATAALEKGKPELAARYMRRAFAVAPKDSDTHAVAAFMELSNGNLDKALALARRAWRLDSYNVRAMCAVCLSLFRKGNQSAAERVLARAIGQAEGEGERGMVAHTAYEIQAHEQAIPILSVLAQDLPLEPMLLHMLAVCYCRLGRYQEALPLWGRMRRVDPEDTVADYCFEALREALDKGEPFEPSYARHVPMEETLRRLSALRTLAEHEDMDALRQAWQDKVSLRRLVAWGLAQPEGRIRTVMLGLLRVVRDEYAREILRDALLQRDGQDPFKRKVLELLFELGDAGPHFVTLARGFSVAMVQAVERDALSTGHEDALKSVLERLEPLEEGERERIAGVWTRLIRSVGVLEDEAAWLEALEWVHRSQGDEGLLPLGRQGMRKARRIKAIWGEEI